MNENPVFASTPIPRDDPSGKGADTRSQAHDWENNFIFFGGVDRRLVSELLELLFGASGLCDFEHVEAHSLAQGPALALGPEQGGSQGQTPLKHSRPFPFVQPHFISRYRRD